MAPQPRFLQDASPTHVALKIFGIAVAIGLLILGFLYIIYASSRRGSGIKSLNPRRRARDPEIEGVNTSANCSSNTHRPHSVDTLPRYEEAGSEALPPGGSEHGATVEGEGGKPPPYTLDADVDGAVDDESDRGDRHGNGSAGVTTSPAPVHLQSS